MLMNVDTSYGRILSVEGEPQIREQITSTLEDSGFMVYQATNGEEALASFRLNRPDVVITAIEMPVMSGLGLLEVLKKESPETPVIVVVTQEGTNQIIDALRLGAWDFITKPVTNATVLEHAVCRALERRRLCAQLYEYRLKLEDKNKQLEKSLAQLTADQKAGKSVQQLFLPKTEYRFKEYNISYKIEPSLYLSGDFVDYFDINDEKLGFYIADVSGHGASSAFITILLKVTIEQLLNDYHQARSEVILHPEQVLKTLSDGILKAKLGKYLTIVYCILDHKKNYLLYSIGGHYPNLILWDGVSASFLPGHGFAVGIFKEANFESYHWRLPEEFTLAMFSDGIFEVMTGNNITDNEHKLLEIINGNKQDAKEVFGLLGVKHNLPDDVTLFLMRREKNASRTANKIL